MIDKIDPWQVFWSILVLVFSYTGTVVTMLRRDYKKLKSKVEDRVLIAECEKIRIECEKTCEKSREQRDKFIERLNQDARTACEDVHSELLKTAHKHATTGNAGEVVK
jgi:hypothetical protein